MQHKMLLLTYSGCNSVDFCCSELYREVRYLLPPSLTSWLEDCCLVTEMLDFFPSLLSSFFLFCKYTETLYTEGDHWESNHDITLQIPSARPKDTEPKR